MKGDYSNYKAQCKQGSYQIYKEKFADYEDKLGYWDYRTFLQIVSEEIFEATCENPDGFELPYLLGFFKIIGTKMRAPGKHTRYRRMPRYKLGATDNYVYGVRWLYHRSPHARHQRYYIFRTSRIYQSKLYKKVLEGKFTKWIRVQNHREAIRLRP
jgi:hypothetical protein